MYVARFSYRIRPIDRDRALTLLARQARAAAEQQLDARLLVPLTRAAGGAALQFELRVGELGEVEAFREQGLGAAAETREWARELSELLLEPPEVELLRVASGEAPT